MAKEHLFQLRRNDARTQRDPWYTPERDIAHIGPNIVHGAMVSIEEKYWEPWFRDFLHDNGVTYQEVLDTEAPRKMARALSQVIKLKNPAVALEQSGFSDLRPAIQALFYVRLGQVLLATVWSGVKDVGKPDDGPPASFQDLLNDINTQFHEIIASEHADEPQGPGRLCRCTKETP